MDGEAPAKRQRRVAILTPVARFVEADFTASLLQTVSAIPASVAWLNVVGHANVPRARNVLVATALAHGFDDIVFIDADIGWDASAFAALFSVPDDIGVVAGAPQRRTEDDISFCGSVMPGGVKQVGSLITGYAATAFMRVRREVFERLADKVEPFDYRGQECRAFFDYKIGRNPNDGKQGFIGEDYFFSMLCMENGIDVWLDPEIELRHWNMAPLTERMSDHITVTQPATKEVSHG